MVKNPFKEIHDAAFQADPEKIRLSNLDMSLAQNYPMQFLGGALAHDKLYENKVHRVGNIIALGEERLSQEFDINPLEIQKIQAFLISLGLGFSNNIEEWKKLREKVQFWEDVAPINYNIHSQTLH